MKLKLNIFIILSLIIFSIGVAQENYNVPAVDKITYELYLKKDWKNLIKTGKKAKSKGMSFYYLDYRMGIAYFELKKYMKAIKYFDKLYRQNPNDAALQEYLYLSYIYSGHYGDARVLASNMNAESKKHLNIPDKNYLINSIDIAGLYENIDNYEYNLESNQDIEQKIMTELSWYGIETEHRIDNRNMLNFSYSSTEISYKNINEETLSTGDYSETMKYHQVYFLWTNHIFKGTNLLFSGQMLTNKVSVPITVNMPGRVDRTRYISYTNYNFVGYIGLYSSLSILNLGIESSFANLDDEYQIQPAFSLTIYPFANTNFFLKIKPIYLLHIDNSGEYYTQKAIQQSLGLALTKKVYYTTTATIGEMKNFTDFAGQYVNNNNDLTKLRWENTFNLSLGQGYFNIHLTHRVTHNINYFKINNQTNSLDYNAFAILAGIKIYIK